LDFDNVSSAIYNRYPDIKILSIGLFNKEQIIHKLSHQKLHINFYKVIVSKKISNGITLNSLRNYPFPIVIFNFIEKYSI